MLQALESSSISFQSVDDLCGLAAQKDPLLKEYSEKNSVKIVACSSRAVRWLFHAADTELSPQIDIYNMREMTAEQILSSLNLESQSCEEDKPLVETPIREEDWLPLVSSD